MIPGKCLSRVYRRACRGILCSGHVETIGRPDRGLARVAMDRSMCIPQFPNLKSHSFLDGGLSVHQVESYGY